MSDWIDRLEARAADRALANRIASGPLPYLTSELLDSVPDVKAIAERLRADGEVEAADELDAIVADVQGTLTGLWEAINEAAEPD